MARLLGSEQRSDPSTRHHTTGRQRMTSDTITPYTAQIADADLNDLRTRLGRVRWPDDVAGADWDYGVPLGHVRDLAARWRDGFDWPAQEKRLNAYPQFLSTIDGEQIHFLHVRSPEAEALPLIVTHGWPMSVFEYLDLIGPLTDPRAHGADPADAFHLVIPSAPGIGFSGPTRSRGWDTARIARAWVALMARLGYQRCPAPDAGIRPAGLAGGLARLGSPALPGRRRP
jgi:epoxide hydrolase